MARRDKREALPSSYPPTVGYAWEGEWSILHAFEDDFSMRNLFVIFMSLVVLGSGWAQNSPVLQPVRLGKHFGYVDGKGVLVVPAELDWAWPMTEGTAGVRMGKEWFLMDSHRQMKKVERCNWVGPFSAGLAPARQMKKWGYLGRDGRWKIEPFFSDARPFREGVAAVQVGGEDAIINKTSCLEGLFPGLDLAPPQGDRMVPASAGGKWGLINALGDYVLEPRMDAILEAKQGRIPFRQGTAWGFLDLAGNVVVPAQYLTVASFADGWARVTLFNAKTGFVNLFGEFSERRKQEVDLPTAAGR